MRCIGVRRGGGSGGIDCPRTHSLRISVCSLNCSVNLPVSNTGPSGRGIPWPAACHSRRSYYPALPSCLHTYSGWATLRVPFIQSCLRRSLDRPTNSPLSCTLIMHPQCCPFTLQLCYSLLSIMVMRFLLSCPGASTLSGTCRVGCCWMR